MIYFVSQKGRFNWQCDEEEIYKFLTIFKVIEPILLGIYIILFATYKSVTSAQVINFLTPVSNKRLRITMKCFHNFDKIICIHSTPSKTKSTVLPSFDDKYFLHSSE
jgi:hypothetical protein